ncbi:MAG: hypothetical protein NTW74_11905 [Acidobacteria bacterium]|nr:hypothetical protein [Acidobacteriota bacterium]
MKISICVAALLLPAALYSQSAALVATYNFQNSLNAAQSSAPALTAVNPRGTNSFLTDTVLGQQRTVYDMQSLNPGQNAGLSLNTTNLVNPNAYSFEMLFAFTDRPNSWRRVFDNQNRTSDRGLYINPSNRWEFSRLTTGTATSPNGPYIHMVLTVSDGRARLYINGTLDINLLTTSMNLTTPDRVVNFFLDNTTDTSTTDFASARVALLRAYTNALSDSEVRDLAANPFSNSVGATAPSFTAAGVRNGATFSENTPIAPGAFFSILGSALSDVTSDWTGRFDGSNAPTTLNGTRVLINDRPAFISFTSPGQINAIAPDTIVPGNVSIVVERNGVRSTAVTAQARALNPAFFTYDQRNRRFIAALTADNSAYIAPADLFGVTSINGIAVRPARPGDFVIAYGMGMGQTNPNLPAGTIPPARDGGHPVSGTVNLRLGTATLNPLYVGLSSFAGVYIVGFQVPPMATGDYELQITINGTSSPTGVVIPVVQ